MDCSLPGSFVHGDSLGKNNLSGLPFPSPGDLPNPGMEPRFPALQANSLPSELPRVGLFKMTHINKTCMHAKLLQSWPTLLDPMDYNSPGCSVHGILTSASWQGC